MRILPRSRIALAMLSLIVLIALSFPGASVYYAARDGRSCARCHEIRPAYHAWAESTHRNVSCKECHGSLLTLDVGFHMNNLNQLITHLRGEAPSRVAISERNVARLMEACKRCHAQEYAQWEAGPHSVTYADIFLDETHNRARLLDDACTRCHGMFYDGPIYRLVTPIDVEGPWSLVNERLATQPTIPCMACHQIHAHGEPLALRKESSAGQDEIHRPSLAFYDLRSQTHFGASDLPLPDMVDGDIELTLAISPDPRQGLCYQCHAPLTTFHALSGDDRTPVGVHQGVSCLACHQKHGQETRASCAACHPAYSNCGLDVIELAERFAQLTTPSPNFHSMRCVDCHTEGIPTVEAIIEALDAENEEQEARE